ncbi:hypothetical protein FIBSPDRAFT_869961 [Athelia psychrophila]|uniref:Uncharacterized protein n=1 Tax=Athelia psychrophila TaxID=1759441 RepID=A0A166BJ66_9AGAM|nr:hypothetical protein FIBSPDRAFT_869961 [Fibularhizoctonia sp. CBS 109695]
MFSSKTFLALAAAATAFVQVSAITCYYIDTPTPDAGVDALQGSINYAIGHTLGEAYPNKGININTTLIRHDDGTYDVYSYNLTVEDTANADVIALVESWDHTTLDGLSASWLVDAVTCIDN